MPSLLERLRDALAPRRPATELLPFDDAAFEAVGSEPFARAYRSGALSWVKASAVAPLVSVDPLGHG